MREDDKELACEPGVLDFFMIDMMGLREWHDNIAAECALAFLKDIDMSSIIRGSKKRSTGSAVAMPLLKSFFLEELKDVYWLEKKLLTAIPKMQKVAKGLEHVLAGHFEKAKMHIHRIERVFGITGEKASGKKCEAMESVLKKMNTLIDLPAAEGGESLVNLLRKLEQYEAGIYADLAHLARTLGMVEVLNILNSMPGEVKHPGTSI